MGFALGLIICTLTTLAFGANLSTIPLMVFIAGSCLVMPIVIVTIGNYMESQNEGLEVWPESHWPGFTLRHVDVFQSYTAW